MKNVSDATRRDFLKTASMTPFLGVLNYKKIEDFPDIVYDAEYFLFTRLHHKIIESNIKYENIKSLEVFEDKLLHRVRRYGWYILLETKDQKTFGIGVDFRKNMCPGLDTKKVTKKFNEKAQQCMRGAYTLRQPKTSSVFLNA